MTGARTAQSPAGRWWSAQSPAGRWRSERWWSGRWPVGRWSAGDQRSGPGPSGSRRTAALPAGVAGLAGLTIGLLADPLIGVAAGVMLGTVGKLTRAALTARREQRELTELLATVRTVARELRAGAQPGVALEAAASAHRTGPGSVVSQLAAVVAADRSDRGRAEAELRAGSESAARLASSWALSSRYGVPWSSLLDAFAADLADRVRAAALRTAQVAGPRVSGYVLAILPALGLLLGIGMGADPVQVLFGTGAGRLLLLVGCLLTSLGLLWTARIVRG